MPAKIRSPQKVPPLSTICHYWEIAPLFQCQRLEIILHVNKKKNFTGHVYVSIFRRIQISDYSKPDSKVNSVLVGVRPEAYRSFYRKTTILRNASRKLFKTLGKMYRGNDARGNYVSKGRTKRIKFQRAF